MNVTMKVEDTKNYKPDAMTEISIKNAIITFFTALKNKNLTDLTVQPLEERFVSQPGGDWINLINGKVQSNGLLSLRKGNYEGSLTFLSDILRQPSLNL